MKVELKILIEDIETVFAGAIAECREELDSDKRYVRRFAVEGNALVLYWVEVPEVPRKEIKHVSSKW